MEQIRLHDRPILGASGLRFPRFLTPGSTPAPITC